MPLRLKFAIGLALIVSAAIVIFPSCGYDVQIFPSSLQFPQRAHLPEAPPLP